MNLHIRSQVAKVQGVAGRLSHFQVDRFLGPANLKHRELESKVLLLAFTYQCKTPLNARPNLISRAKTVFGPNPSKTLEILVALALRGILH